MLLSGYQLSPWIKLSDKLFIRFPRGLGMSPEAQMFSILGIEEISQAFSLYRCQLLPWGLGNFEDFKCFA